MASEGKKKHRLFRFTARTLMIIAAAALALSYLSIFVNPAKVWFVTLFGLLYLPFLVLNVILLVFALLRRSKAVWIPAVALLPSLLLFGWHFQLGGTSSPPGPGDMKIVSYNVGRFNFGDDTAACRDSIFGFLRRQDADIICLQEVAASRVSFADLFAKEFPGYDVEYYSYSGKSGRYGNVTLSRFPLKNKGKITFDQSANMALYGDYEIDGRLFRIYNCHFQSYNISLAGIGRALKKNTSEAVKNTEDKMRFSLRLRPRQVDAVIKNIQDCKLDAFVAGDFNDTPDSPAFSVLSPSFRLLSEDLYNGREGTIRFNGSWELIDLFYGAPASAFPDSSFRVFAVRIPFLMVRDRTHPGEKPLRTYSGPRYLGGVSDHLPVYLQIH